MILPRCSFVACLIILLLGDVSACVVCAVPRQSLLDTIEDASDIVIARPVNRSEPHWIVGQVFKGSRVQVGQTLAASRTRDAPEVDQNRMFQWNSLGQFWTDIGEANEEFLSFANHSIRHRTKRGHIGSLQSQVEYFGFFVPYLEHENSLIADAAHTRIASAPYAVLCRLGNRFTAEQLIRWIENQPADVSSDDSRSALYITLLGICGGDTATLAIDGWLADRMRHGSCDQLGAILTAHGELHGDATIDLVERRYILSRDRSLNEITAAVDALRVHSDADGSISRQQIQATFQTLLRKRKPLLELVVDDFRQWQDWSVAPLLMQVYASGKQPWNHTLIMGYLRECPLPEAAIFIANSQSHLQER